MNETLALDLQSVDTVDESFETFEIDDMALNLRITVAE